MVKVTGQGKVTTPTQTDVPIMLYDIIECRSIVRDESSVYFNVTAKHV